MSQAGRFDVAIVGAGPAGAACAIALARAGSGRVALIDPGPADGAPAAVVGETIPPDARLLLDALGVREAFEAEGHEPCLGSCSAWGSDTIGHNDFLLNPQGSGWHLDRARFDAFLRREARRAGATLLSGMRLADVAPSGDGSHELRLAGAGRGRRLRARFVVDASGRASAFARRVGARRAPLDRLTFVYGFFDASRGVSRSRMTLLEAVAEGWWYAAALPGDRLAVAFAGDSDQVRAAGMGRDPRWLAAALRTRHLAPRLDGCRYLAGSLISRVVASFRLEPASGPGWLAVGDAAACYDPISGQGIYKAIADGIEAGDRISQATPAEHHDAEIRARFAEYLDNRNYFYGLERRWPDSAFWRRRQMRSELRAAA